MEDRIVDYIELANIIHDIHRLRYNVSKMSFVTRSIALIRIPYAVNRKE